MSSYSSLTERLARGWNTWNARNVLSHVLLPEGFALSLGLKDYWKPAYLKEALIGGERASNAHLLPGPRSWDGSYTDLTLQWQDIHLRIRSATDGDDVLLLVEPKLLPGRRATVIVESGMLWNRPGLLLRDGEQLVARLPDGKEIRVWAAGRQVDDPFVQTQTPYLALSCEGPFAIGTGQRRSLEAVRKHIDSAGAKVDASRQRWGAEVETADAVLRCVSWNTIYDPANQRIINPVSRNWCTHFGGYVIFCWDTFFASWLAALDSKDHAYANAIAMVRSATEDGFVPCWEAGTGVRTLDRSNPPVGSLAVREIYRLHSERWFLEEVFDGLLTWNRWWLKQREVDGLLCLGSHPVTPSKGHWEEVNGVGALQAALFEAALDNSPMYDGVAWDSQKHVMRLHDVGLNSLYAMDCGILADIAAILQRPEERELRERAETWCSRLDRLWDDDAGIWCNRTTAGQFSHRYSPTSFYPLLTGRMDPARVVRAVNEHLLNPAEFWGEWAIPATPRNDPAFADQRYWRGKIWPPMNALVWIGLRRSGQCHASAALAKKSQALLLREWREKGHVHENYTADTGLGCDREDSDRYYHWGGLLGLPALVQASLVPGPSSAISKQ